MEKPYPKDYLIDRFYEELEEKSNSNKSKTSLPIPQINIMNKKTFVSNFSVICQKIKREPLEVLKYFETELSTKCSLDTKGVLIITGIFRNDGVKNILTKFLKDFVICSECGSLDTEIIKENRIRYLNCTKCFSKKSKI